jgi:KRAB domain-containing zinc finger protein
MNEITVEGNDAVCNVGKPSVLPATFKTIEKPHSGEKPYVCQQCGNAFSSCSYFKTHERTLTGAKPR